MKKNLQTGLALCGQCTGLRTLIMDKGLISHYMEFWSLESIDLVEIIKASDFYINQEEKLLSV